MGLPFAIEIIMFNMYMCMHVRACMCTCVGGILQPPTPTSIHPSTPLELQAAQNTKIQ